MGITREIRDWELDIQNKWEGVLAPNLVIVIGNLNDEVVMRTLSIEIRDADWLDE